MSEGPTTERGRCAPAAADWQAAVEYLGQCYPQLRHHVRGYRAFLQHCSARVRATAPGVAGDELHLADLYLAWACGRGDPDALEVFEIQLVPELRRALVRLGLQPALRDEVLQSLRVRLFVEQRDRPALITRYSGRGSLRRWLRIVGLRWAGRVIRRDTREVPCEEDALELLQPLHAPSEAQVSGRAIAGLYRTHLRASYVAALGSITPRERTLLRLRYVDELGIEAIARMYRLHRVTVYRQINGARQKLRTAARTQLKQRLEVDSAERDSILRLVDSQLGEHLCGVLASS